MVDDPGIKVRSETIDGATIISPEGDIDLSRSPVLRASLRQAQSARPRRLVVDLSGVDYMDSSGVATLVEALQHARRGNTRMVLCGMKDRVRSIFEIARLHVIFEIVATREAALNA
ncbi:STAS domain-containing protein [Leptolyngbya sp. 15MV]|nr:STAS domain-containing protein [Leptolyngbya sp. 15MV]